MASHSILLKSRGSKLIKMVYAQGDSPEQAIQTVDVDAADSNRFSIDDGDITALAKMAVTIEKPLWSSDGYRMGQGW